ncbi:MAG: hypothetical protein WDN49_06970 [Acetobacteraceae bacterium]
MVTSIEVMRSTHGPELDIVRVRGLTSTDGWTDAELVPLTHGVPPDGILDLIFVAKPPPEAAESTGFEAIEAILPIEADHPYKGIRVHGATNPVTLAAIPGYAESGPPRRRLQQMRRQVFRAKGRCRARKQDRRGSGQGGEICRRHCASSGPRTALPSWTPIPIA